MDTGEVKMNVYVHLLNGQPGKFKDGRVSYCFRRASPARYSLKQIREEQQISAKWYLDRGVEHTHGYVLCKVEQQ